MSGIIESLRIGIGVSGGPCAREEVTALFVELRAPLLRYLRSLGSPQIDEQGDRKSTRLNSSH